MATQANPWDADPVVSSGTNPWDADPVVASPAAPATRSNPRLDRIKSFTDETDRLLGLTPGTSMAQLMVESGLRDEAVSPAGAQGLAQVMPATRQSLEKRLGRKLDPFNSEDSLLIQREVMRENIQKFGNREDALRAYNAGWDKNRWNNPETAAYVDKINSRMGAMPTEGGSTGYKPFAEVRKNVDPATLYQDRNWLAASALLYEMWERKPFEGEDKDLAEWGKISMGNFNFNTVSMAEIAHAVSQGTQEQKEAFLFMLDTYDNTEWSWEGAGRAAKGIVTDPLNLLGLGTLGVGTAVNIAARKAAKESAKAIVLKSLGRTGITAGLEGALYTGVQSTIVQGVEVSAGRREEISKGKLALDMLLGGTAGVVFGTAADAAASKIAGLVRGTPEVPANAAPSPVSGASSGTPVAGTPGAPAVANAAPANTNLTPDEILAAKARQQDGRLPADEVAPDMTAAPAKPMVDIPEVNTGLRTTRVNGEEVAKVTKADVETQAAPIVDQLRALNDQDLPVALEQLRTGKFTLEEQRVISTATRLYADELAVATKEAIVARDALLAKATRTPEEDAKIQSLTEQINALEARSSAQLTDDAFGSMAGTILNDRRLGSPSGVQTVDEIMAEKGVSREDAQKIWAEMVTQAEKDVEVQKVVSGYDQKINQALAAGDLREAARITAQKQREVAGMTEQVAPGSASLIAKLTELAISNVFSFGTVIINLIPSGLKTLVIPGLKAIFKNPLEKATRVELSASYAAMRSSFGGALSAARAAYRYEQALLTRDGIRLVEGEMALTGKLGGALRVFPRILNASDEFLSRLNYDAFVAGKAASEAAIEATEKGLKGEAFDKFVKEATDAALKAGRQAEKGEELVQPIVNKGVNLGLTGDELFRWVEKEVLKNPDALLKGTDEEALDFVRDVLYKRKFSGDGFASKAAQSYEDAMTKFPSLKLLVGQLFFRTPIRVFEEGVRLTPGLQIIAPNFLADLAGKNGTLRQVRAQAEAMTSLAVAGAVLSLYSQGRITGDGAYSDWKQQRTRTDGPLPEPYTIKLEDGSTWSYRGFDPLATPVKIMINGLERMDRLRIREAQGEFIDKSLYDQAVAYVTVGTTAIAQALRDANLVTGLSETIKVAENLADPERKEGAWLKFMGDKLFLLVPNTLHKIAKDNDPTIKDPQTFWQMVDEKLARPFGQNEKMIKTAYSYDPLGNVRKIADEGRIWTLFSTATVEERGKGMSEEGQFVLAEMDRLARVTGATFKAPTKHAMLGDMDLRTVMSKDGTRTLYDVWQDNYRALNPDKILYPIAAAPVPDGTYKFKEGKATLMQEQIKMLQDAAFNQLMAEEERIIDKVISQEINKAKAGAGLFDTKRPY